MKKVLILGLLFLAALLIPKPGVFAQCNPDVTAPYAVVTEFYYLPVGPTQTVTLTGAQLDQGSSDDCTAAGDLQFFIEPYSSGTTPPATTELSFTAANLGNYIVDVWVVDNAGNFNHALVEVFVTPCQQSSLACNDYVSVNIPSGETYTVTPDLILEGSQYCSYNNYIISLDGVPMGPEAVLSSDDAGLYTIAISSVGNGQVYGTCWGNLEVNSSCNGDSVTCLNGLTVALGMFTNETTVFAVDFLTSDGPAYCPDNLYYLAVDQVSAGFSSVTFGLDDVGTHVVDVYLTGNGQVIDNCSLTVVVEDPCANDQVSPTVAVQEFISIAVDTLLGTPVLVTPQMVLEAAFDNCTPENQLTLEIQKLDDQGVPLTGFGPSVSFDETEVGLTRLVSVRATDLAGNSNFAWAVAEIIPIPVYYFPLQLDPTCARMLVDIATPKIRPCQNGKYYISYINVSTQPIENSYVEVALDNYLDLEGSSIPSISQGNNLYRFETGTLQPGENGQFTVDFSTDCNAPVGATHCSEAHVFPVASCPGASSWSGANVVVSGFCQNDSIFLSITNAGLGANAQLLEYIVVEDVLMREEGDFLLSPGQTKNLDPIASDGSTFRLQAQQEPGHPYGGAPWVAIEGCAGFTPGQVIQFQTNNADPFAATYCRDNVSSFDPNDKLALPTGYGSEQYIEQNDMINYMVHFQNEGTDTAFHVTIVDTLSSFLNSLSVRPGASSHPYVASLEEGHILKLDFYGINLPHKGINEEGSKGFVEFEIEQKANNALGTQILNDAAIYFDQNDPVITAETRHTVGHHFVEVSSVTQPANYPELSVWPNPTSDYLVLDAPYGAQNLTVIVTDLQGKTVKSLSNVQFPVRLQVQDLTSGMYHFQIREGQTVVWTGKMVVKG